MLRNHLLLFIAALAVSWGCNREPDSAKVKPSADPAQAGPADSSEERSADVPEENVAAVAKAEASELRELGRVPPFELTDQRDQTFASSDLEGKVAVYNFFFTRCAATCPMQTAQLVKLQKTLQETPLWEEVGIVSISVDPEYDSPNVLQEYAERFSADQDHWAFLTGSRSEIWELSKKGFMLPAGERPADANMPIVHSSKLVLVDREGDIRGFYEALEESEVARLIADVKQLAASEPSAADNPFASASPASREDAESAENLDELEGKVEGAFGQEVASPTDRSDPTDASTDQKQDLYVPSRQHVNPPWMRERAEAQRAAIAESGVFHDFQFADRVLDSGITFVHEIVDDAGKTYKAAHYDHGNGLATADVDQDGHYDLYFTTQLGANELYRNRGDGTFENITERAGVGLADRISVTASFADVDNDGDPDLFVTTVRGGNALFENTGDGTFRDITREAGLEYIGHSSAAVFFDYNRDGLLDMFLTNVGKYTTEEVGRGEYYVARTDAFAGHLKPELSERSILYKNLGGLRFQDVSAETKLHDESWSGDACPIDVNDDGWPDLYVLNMQGHDEYYENVDGRHFERRSREVFPKTPWGSMGIQVFDFDNDGKQDIYITDMHSDMSERVGIDKEKLKADMKWPESMLQSGGMSIFGNAFYRKLSPGQYEEISDKVGAENYWPWGLSVGDLNADGFEDAFVASSMNLPYRYGVNSLLLNDQGKKFVDSEFVLGVEPRRDGRTSKPWFELDADGPDRDHPYLEQAGIRSGKVVVWGTVGSRSSVVFDLDQDGDLDVVTNDFHSEPMVLVSNLSEQKPVNFLKVRLVGTKSNRDGLGAKVQVVAGGNTYTQIHDGQSGYLSQSSSPLYFGLGDAPQVDSLRVTWPSGTEQEITGPMDANRLLVVEES